MAKKQDETTVKALQNGVTVELFRDGRPEWLVFPGDEMEVIGGRNMKSNTLARAKKAATAYKDYAIGRYEHAFTDAECHIYRWADLDDPETKELDEVGVVSSMYRGPIWSEILLPTQKRDFDRLFHNGWAMLNLKRNPRTGTNYTLTPAPDGCATKHDYVASAIAGIGLRVCVLPFNGIAKDYVQQLSMEDPEEARRLSTNQIATAQKRSGMKAKHRRDVKEHARQNGGEVLSTNGEPLLIEVFGENRSVDMRELAPQAYWLHNAYGDRQFNDYWDAGNPNAIAAIKDYAARGWSIALD